MLLEQKNDFCVVMIHNCRYDDGGVEMDVQIQFCVTELLFNGYTHCVREAELFCVYSRGNATLVYPEFKHNYYYY
jgi:hypothetical protein